jgi:hypothetical protein
MMALLIRSSAEVSNLIPREIPARRRWAVLDFNPRARDKIHEAGMPGGDM